jgi:hypothetical protein
MDVIPKKARRSGPMTSYQKKYNKYMIERLRKKSHLSHHCFRELEGKNYRHQTKASMSLLSHN